MNLDRTQQSVPLRVPFVGFKKQFHSEKENILAAMLRIFESGQFILGEAVEDFENKICKITAAPYAVGVGNGTDSILLSLKALGIGSGDEVITVANSWISSVAAIVLAGAKPVLIDVLPDQNMDPAQIKAAITSRTRCIMPVHLTGRLADMDAIQSIARQYDLPILEDAAQAIGSTRGAWRAGSSGLLGSFSLHPLKNLNAAGDAGIITTQDATLARRLRLLRNHGLKNRDEVEFFGYNSRLDALQAALLLSRLPQLDGIISKRRAIAAQYSASLAGIVKCPDPDSTFHLYVIQTPHRNALQTFLSSRGIETKIHYPIPIHLQEAASSLGYGLGSLTVTEKQANEILSLPIHQYLESEQVDFVIESIEEYFRRNNEQV